MSLTQLITQSQMTWIDGGNAQNMRMGAAQINLDPPVETIEEVKVLTNNYSAEYGASASGVVIETTRSGTNRIHGSGYEFFRNNAMAAPRFFAPIVNGRKLSPELRYNVFGATVGGPIRKDKTFFFAAYEGQRLHTASNTILTVPTLLLAASLNTPDQGITAPFYLRDGVPVSPSASALNDSFGAVPVGQATTTSVTYFDPHRGIGYSEQFNFGLQREIGGGMVVEVGALGNLSRKLANASLSLNQIVPQILGPQRSSQKDRPFPQFTDVQIQNPTLGISSYYAAMVRIEKRYSRGLSFGTNYTWSKYLGNVNMTGAAEGNDAGTYSNYLQPPGRLRPHRE
jgi:hypothetical protein